MGSLGPEKIFLIVLVVLLLFGAKRLPEFGTSLGKGIREFKSGLAELGRDDTDRRPALASPREPVGQSAPDGRDVMADPKRLLS